MEVVTAIVTVKRILRVVDHHAVELFALLKLLTLTVYRCFSLFSTFEDFRKFLILSRFVSFRRNVMTHTHVQYQYCMVSLEARVDKYLVT